MHSVPFKFMHAFIQQKMMDIFDSRTHGNATNIVNGWHMMSLFHEEKDIDRKDHLKLNLE